MSQVVPCPTELRRRRTVGVCQRPRGDGGKGKGQSDRGRGDDSIGRAIQQPGTNDGFGDGGAYGYCPEATEQHGITVAERRREQVPVLSGADGRRGVEPWDLGAQEQPHTDGCGERTAQR